MSKSKLRKPSGKADLVRPGETKGRAELRAHAIVRQIGTFQGPLPPPEMLGAYERIHPGLAERLVSMAEKNAEHRRDVERTAVTGSLSLQRLGTWLSFALALIFIVAGVVLVLADKQIAGTGSLAAAVLGVAVALIRRRRRPAQEHAASGE